MARMRPRPPADAGPSLTEVVHRGGPSPGDRVHALRIGRTAYALVTLVGPDVGGVDVVGIYRVDGPHAFTVVADIGAFSAANPPSTPFAVPSGVQYAFETYRGGFLVTDGHHNRVLRVTLDGAVSEVAAFGDIVPTGLEVSGDAVRSGRAWPDRTRLSWARPSGAVPPASPPPQAHDGQEDVEDKRWYVPEAEVDRQEGEGTHQREPARPGRKPCVEQPDAEKSEPGEGRPHVGGEGPGRQLTEGELAHSPARRSPRTFA